MKKIGIALLILCSTEMYAQNRGVGANIQIHSESETTQSGGSQIKVQDQTFILGGSYHYFKDKSREYEGTFFAGYNHSDNGVSETSQNFFGIGGGINYHILQEKQITSGLGLKTRMEYYLEPDRNPSVNYDWYIKGSAALELPFFLDVALNKSFLIRFSAVAASFKFSYHSQEIDGVKESRHTLDFYTTATNDTKEHNWFPISIYGIYKF